MRKQILCLLITLGVVTPLSAHPYFIRLGYSTCTTCHISPQGGSILTAYGEGVERALSLLREPEQNEEEQSPRLLYDTRALVVGTSTNGVPASSFQLLSSNSFKISEHQRLTSTVSVTSPTLAKGLGGKATVTVPIFVWEFRPSEHFELMAGRDTLPTGLGSPDPGTFIRLETDPGSPAYPTQIKGFWRSDRWQLTPYAFGPSGYEDHAAREWGSGVLGGRVFFKQHAILGVSGEEARGSTFDRRSIGGYARFGFGKLALLAEHEVAARSTNVTTGDVVGHTRVVYVPWGWLETWLSTEEFVTYTPTRNHIVRVMPGMQARFSKNMLFGFTSREVFTPKGQTRVYTATLTLKTAN